MHAALEYQTVRPGLFFWQVYEPAVKTELCCCAFDTAEGLVFCDPVRLAEGALEELMEGRVARGILLTNGNHERYAGELARRLGIGIWAPAGIGGEGLTAENAENAKVGRGGVEDGEVVFGGVEGISLEGFGPGEMAFWRQGVLIVGDALIHAAPYGFSVLPAKYCEDAGKGKESLKKLLRYPVEILMFAHGLPIVARARERLAGLVE